MKIEVFPDAATVARRGAEVIAEAARRAVAERGRFVLAVSGGRTPWIMLGELAGMELPWRQIHLVQVDERVAPAGHSERNLTHIRASLAQAPIPPDQIHPMPVEAQDLEAAAQSYGQALEALAGSPAVLDLVHLGMGPDGHTASLVPGDPALEVADRDVALTGAYQGRSRMTLTYPVLNRARHIMWQITGAEKVAMLARLRDADPSIPAGRVGQDNALVLADEAAAGGGASG